ncbi:hypothetical protein [Bradyrhizobium sp. LTSPM299]|uniref:hypothetical protein n=1 Tax=Bradyrhizobium sp. LTSPM299 TaxID=1619233 RepID=UPI000AB37A48|nr:hypothetical protein [Bradyrhizobium sp. LTSPM299]
MDKLDAVRTYNGRAAVFPRFGAPGYVVIAALGGEVTIEHEAWMQLPLWRPTPVDARRQVVDLGQLDLREVVLSDQEKAKHAASDGGDGDTVPETVERADQNRGSSFFGFRDIR